jgi:hypothetical protein
MARKRLFSTFVEEIKRQLNYLRDAQYAYRSMQLYVAGVEAPWEFEATDEFEFHEDTGVLIVRDGPTGQGGLDNEEVPEYVFRLEAIVAAQLV